MKIYPEVLTSFIKPQIWLFQVVVLQRTAKKWTKVKNARAGRSKLLFFIAHSICKSVTFSLPCRCLSSLFTLNHRPVEIERTLLLHGPQMKITKELIIGEVIECTA